MPCKLPRDSRCSIEFGRMISSVLTRLKSSKDSKSNTKLEGKEGVSNWGLNAWVGRCTFFYIFCTYFFAFFTSLRRCFGELYRSVLSCCPDNELLYHTVHVCQSIVGNNQPRPCCSVRSINGIMKFSEYRAVPGSTRSTHVPHFEMMRSVQCTFSTHTSLLVSAKNLSLTVR